jgi:hypothetical protein
MPTVPSRLLALCLLVAAALPGGEAPPPPPKDPGELAPPVVYLPFDKVEKVDPAGRTVFLPYEEFIKLWQAGKKDPADEPPKPPVDAVLAEVDFTGAVTDEVATFTVAGTASSLSQKWATVALPPELGLTGFSAEGATLERTAAGLALHLPKAGDYRFSGKSAAPVQADARGRRSLTVALPAAGGGRFELAIPGEGLKVDLEPKLPAALVRAGGMTTVKAIIGGARQVTVSWQGDVQEQVGPALVLAAMDVGCLVNERAVRSTFAGTVEILRNASPTLAIRLPAGVQVLSVNATDLGSWDSKGDDLELRFKEPKKGEVQVKVVFERKLPPLEAGQERELEVAQPLVAAAARHTGNFVLFEGEGMAVQVLEAAGYSQINPQETGEKNAASAYRYLAEPGPVKLRQRRLESELRAGVHQWLRIGKEEDRIVVAVDLDVRLAGRFAVVLRAPETWELLDITGTDIDDVRPAEKPENGRLAYTVSLRQKLLGTAQLLCAFKAPPMVPREARAERFAATILQVDGAKQVRGDLLISAPASWSLAATTTKNLAGAKPDVLRNEGALQQQVRQLDENEVAALAFTFLRQDVELGLELTPRSREIRLQQELLVTIDEGQLTGRCIWHGEVRYSALTSLRITAPTALDELLHWKAPHLAQKNVVARDDGISTWELTFAAPLLGPLSVSVDYTLKHAEKLTAGQTRVIEVAPLNILEVTRLESIQAVARRGSVEVSATAKDLDGLAVGDVPPGLRDSGLVAAFRGPQAAPLALTAVRHDLVSLADAGVQSLEYVAHLAEDRVLKIRGVAVLVTRGRPHLDLRLPANAKLLEVAVDGRMRPPSRRDDGVLMVPLGDQSGPVEQTVVFIYESPLAGGKLGMIATIPVELPRLAYTAEEGRPLSVERTELWMYLPETHHLASVSGDLVATTPGSVLGGMAICEGGDDLGCLPGAPDLEETYGLTNRISPRGLPHYLSRIGDGGSVVLRVISRGGLLWTTLLAAAAAIVLCWYLRRRGTVVAGLTLATIVALLGLGQPALQVAIGFAIGLGLGLLLLTGRVIRRSVLAALETRRQRRQVPIPAAMLAGAPELPGVDEILGDDDPSTGPAVGGSPDRGEK